MLDIRLIRERPEVVETMLQQRRMTFPLARLVTVDRERRDVLTRIQGLRRRKNVVSASIAAAKKAGETGGAVVQEMRSVTDEIAELETRLRALDSEWQQLMEGLPNLPDPSVPVGPDASANVEVRRVGEPRRFPFPPHDHIELGVQGGWLDLERAARVAGARFYFLRGDVVRLNYALVQLGLDFLGARGFTLVQPPYLLKREAMAGAIILSDFEDVIYKAEGEDLYLIGTAEHALAAMHMGEVFSADSLPRRYAGISPCFRREAGAHGRDTKGIFRVHQFEKVEQFVYCRPEESAAELERLRANAEAFFQLLGLPFRVVVLATGEMGKVAAKTYDLEGWFAGQGQYRELVSCSNCTDYQARRLHIRYRSRPHEEARLVHTLNSTLVATERTVAALLEYYQEGDGAVRIPRALQPYMGGVEVLRARAG